MLHLLLSSVSGLSTPSRGAVALAVLIAAASLWPCARCEARQTEPTEERREFPLGDPPFDLDWWDWGRPPRHRYSRRLSDPFESGSNHFLQHMILIPRLEGYRLVDPGRFSLDVGFEALRESEPGGDEDNRFVASFYDLDFRVAYGLTSLFELRASFDVGWFKPDSNETFDLTQEGQRVTPPDRADTTPGIGNVLLGLKILSAWEQRDHLGLSTILTLKLPMGKKDWLSSGRGDFALSFAGSARIQLGDGLHLFGHSTVGVSFFDEENVFPEKVYLNPSAFYSLSFVFPLRDSKSPFGAPCALSLWAQGNSNAFRKMDALNQDPLTVHLGFRIELAGIMFDLSGGAGVNKAGAADFVANFSAGSDF